MDESAPESASWSYFAAVQQWLVLRANRWVLTGVILIGSFALLVAASHLQLTPLRTVATEQETLDTLFAAFIGAIITGTAIVVTINQLVLSQELGAVGDQRERMRESLEFQQAVENVVLEQPTSPPEPAVFLTAMLDGLDRQARQLQEMTDLDGPKTEMQSDVHGEITAYADNLRSEAAAAREHIEGSQFGSFDVLWGILQFNYSWYLSRGRQLQQEYQRHQRDESGTSDKQMDEPPTGEITQALSSLIESLRLVGPAREHFKTLYFQWELIDLSRALLVISVPALLVMGSMILYVDETTLPGTLLGIDNLVWLSSAAFTVGIAPFVVFIVSLLRISTVAKQTLAMGPFILLESRR